MTDKKVTPHTLEYLLLKGALSELPQEDQVRVNATVELLLEVLRDAGPLGVLALSLVGARILSAAEIEANKGEAK
jgi:hypothetical protein